MRRALIATVVVFGALCGLLSACGDDEAAPSGPAPSPLPDGAVVLPDGAVVLPDGAIVTKDGSPVSPPPDGSSGSDTSSPPVDSSNVVDVTSTVDVNRPPPPFVASTLAVGAAHACAIDAAGLLRCWGGGGKDSPTPLNEATTYESVAVGYSTSCAIRAADHALDCWTSAQYAPTSRDTSSFKQVSVGHTHQCVIATQDDRLLCWGLNNAGELGSGDVPSQQTALTPVDGNIRWSRVTAGASHTCGLDLSGAAYCWGANQLGQIGDNGGNDGDANIPYRRTPTPIAQGTTWATISAGVGATCGVTSSGGLQCWGFLANTRTLVPTSVDSALDWATVSVGSNHACAIKKNGRLYCWGSNNFGEVGNGSSTLFIPNPTPVDTDPDWVDVDVGEALSCGRKSNGAILCWGTNQAGQLGTGNAFHRSPTKIGAEYVDVSAYANSTCAVKNNGELQCWGVIPGGGFLVQRQQSPMTIAAATTWASVTIGAEHSCARRKTDDVVHCWGEGFRGELGLGDTREAAVPTSTGFAATIVSPGEDHTCAIAPTSSLLHCWGSGSSGQTLHPDSNVPMQSGTDTWSAISAGRSASCGVRTNGEMHCFGSSYTYNSTERVGTDADWTFVTVRPTDNSGHFYGVHGGRIATWTNARTLTHVGIESNWKSVALGGGSRFAFTEHMCAIRTTGVLACSGANGAGQLGDGTNTARPSLTDLTMDGWATVTAGGAHTCGIRTNGDLYCWGDNVSGQIGDGSLFSRTPVEVR